MSEELSREHLPIPDRPYDGPVFEDAKDRRGALRRVIAPMAGAGLLALLLIASGPAAPTATQLDSA